MLNTVVLTVSSYNVSVLELLGTLSGLACVWLAARQMILTWPVGMFSMACFFALFYQVNLYSDMLLQVYFFVMSIYGWWNWNREKQSHLPVTRISGKMATGLIAALVVLTLSGGFLMSGIHNLMPEYFSVPAAFPYADTFIAWASVFALILQARRKLENWILWLAVDILAVFVYADRGIMLVCIEYAVFTGLAVYGFYVWRKELAAETGSASLSASVSGEDISGQCERK
jgi:nicotinamide mononucleotide transporter